MENTVSASQRLSPGCRTEDLHPSSQQRMEAHTRRDYFPFLLGLELHVNRNLGRLLSDEAYPCSVLRLKSDLGWPIDYLVCIKLNRFLPSHRESFRVIPSAV